ncbi:TetR/AcrR family transcriptional regulator, partial [Streptomyces sp. NPDC059956]
HMLSAASQFAQGAQPDIWRRYLEILLNGLKRRPDNAPLSTPSLGNPTVEHLMGLTRPVPPQA